MDKVYNGHSKASGIYQIINKVNGKLYIGQAQQLATRAMQHEKALKANKHGNKHLQAAWNLYGSDAFEFTVLQVVEDKTERDAAEQALISEWYGDNCYNIRKDVFPLAGTWSSTPEETSLKRSLLMKGNKRGLGVPCSEEKKEKLHNSMKTSEAFSRAVETLKGREFSEESRRKMSEACKGRKHSPETIEKLRAANLGKKASKETLEKLSSARKGKERSPDTRKKISESSKGKVFSEEHKANLKKARKAYHERMSLLQDLCNLLLTST